EDRGATPHRKSDRFPGVLTFFNEVRRHFAASWYFSEASSPRTHKPDKKCIKLDGSTTPDFHTFSVLVLPQGRWIPQTPRSEHMSKIMQFVRNESGATAIEYGLIAAGISVAIVTVVQTVGTSLNATF